MTTSSKKEPAAIPTSTPENTSYKQNVITRNDL